MANTAKANPKKFWQYINRTTKIVIGIGDLETPSNRLSVNDKDKAEILANFFSSVFTQENMENMPTVTMSKSNGGLESYEIGVEDVRKKLSILNPNKSPGSDNLHPSILREMKNVLDKPLTMLYQETLTTGMIPDDWKHAKVTAIFKKGEKKKPNNYRPVSLTSIPCKVMELIILDQIMKHMKRNNLFSNKQFGFLDGRSTVLQLLIVLDKWTRTIDEGGSIDCIYCDFKKAFDKVPHKQLLKKIEGYGIRGEILGWIKAFLSDRTQQVIVNGETSQCKEVISGIPQGSVLGPLLFVIFINDLPTQVKSDIFLFANDTKIFRNIRSEDDRETLQKDINTMLEWANKWQLEFHPDKCVSMSINNKEDQPRTYKMKETTLK